MKKSIVVIGAGLAGTLIANELAGNCDVTLLELGESDHIGYPKIVFANKPLAAVKTVCTGAGGTTNLWHNGLIPIHAKDVTSDEFRALIIDAEKYTDRAASRLFWVDHPYKSEYESVLTQMKSTAKRIGVFSDGIDCLLYPKKYKGLRSSPGVSARYEVTDVDFVATGNSIGTLKYRVKGTQYAINPDTVIISAGALGSPKLLRKALLALGIPPDKAGVGFMDHPIGFVGKVRIKERFNKAVRSLNLSDKGSYECRTAIRVKSTCGNYTCAAFLRPALTMENNLSIYKYKSLLGASSGTDRIRNMLSPRLFHPDILAEIASHLFSVTVPGRTYNIFVVLEQKRGQSSVSYEGDNWIVDWSISKEDLSTYHDVLSRLAFMLSEVTDEMNIKTDIDESWLWSHAHHSGTISLGSQPDSCVDGDLRMHSCDNVFVCDGSIIQEHSYANTGLTIGQLAMRLAETVSK